jgi:maltose alpha-D-glucosyltransferase/alpha-amylase
VRHTSRAFGRGSIEILLPPNQRILAFLRSYEDELILVACNLAGSAEPAEFDLSRFAGRVPIEMWSGRPFPRIGELPYFLTFGPYAYYWFRLAPAEEAS